MALLDIHSWGPTGAAPVLVLHGVTNTGRRYRRLAEEGLPERRVVAPDLRGHGRSTWDPPWDVASHVADIGRALDALGIGRVPVVGHSFGGLLAMALAAAAPERVERIVLLDPAVAMEPGWIAERAEETRHDDGWVSLDEARAERLGLRPAHSRHTVDEDLATHAEQGPDGRVRFRYSRPAVITAWSEMALPPPSLAAYPGEVLLVPAMRGPYVSDALRASLRRDLGERLREHGVDSGHMIVWDAHDELVALLRDVLGLRPAPA